jgi:DNA-binding IclR family transcriptional regulator
MSAIAKVLEILQHIRNGHSRLTAKHTADLLGVSLATAYRYLAELESVGLVERASVNEYVLGPTVVELDRLIRVNDPLLAAAHEIMEDLCARTGATVLLSRLHSLKVVCIREVRGPLAPRVVGYERGRAMPLFRGATSKVIMANLSKDLLEKVAQQHGPELRAARLPTSGDELARAMAKLRSAGVCFTRGEVDRSSQAWAVAVRHGKKLLGSMSLVYDARTGPADPSVPVKALVRAGLRVEGRLAGPGAGP